MSETTTILSLPLIQANQAQKHITHNEALRRLDALVQPVVADLDRTDVPVSPNAGDRHIVADGATGAWAGQDNAIAVREDSAWAFITPSVGWRVHVAALGQDVVFDGSAWMAGGTGQSAVDQVDMLGVNTAADSINRLAVASDATLLSHDGGGHQVKVNKSAVTETNSLLFQTGWSGRAEMGCAGDDGFSVKVSDDGAAWNSAIVVDPGTGRVEFPSGARVAKTMNFGGRWFCYSDNRWVTFSPAYGTISENNSTNAGTGPDPDRNWNRLGIAVSEGTTLTGVRGLLRASSDEVTGFDAHVVFQHGPATGAWDSTATATFLDIGRFDGLAAGERWEAHSLSLGAFVAPADGLFSVFLRPVGTISTTRYIYSNLALNMID